MKFGQVKRNSTKPVVNSAVRDGQKFTVVGAEPREAVYLGWGEDPLSYVHAELGPRALQENLERRGNLAGIGKP